MTEKMPTVKLKRKENFAARRLRIAMRARTRMAIQNIDYHSKGISND